MIAWWWIGCAGTGTSEPTPGVDTSSDADADADADADTDADADADSDADTDTDSDADSDADTDPTTATTAETGLGPLPDDVAVFDGLQTRLSTDGGCYDALLWATNQGATAIVKVNVADATGIAAAAGGTYNGVVDLASPPVQVSVSAQTGSRLTGNLCTGAYNPYGNPIVDEEWAVIAGQLELTLRATDADAVLTDVDLRGTGGSTGRIDRLEILGVPIGFFPP